MKTHLQACTVIVRLYKYKSKEIQMKLNEIIEDVKCAFNKI